MRKIVKAPSRKERARQTKKKIRDQALRLFREKGFDRTSVDAISRASGVSKGAFYAHYSSKYSLIQEYLDSLDVDYRRQIASMPEGRGALSVLADFIDRIAVTLQSEVGLDLLGVVYKAEISREISIDPFVSKDRELYRILRDILESGKKEGSFRPDIDSDRVSGHIVMAIRGMVFEWCSRAPDFDLRLELKAHLEILTRGIRTA